MPVCGNGFAVAGDGLLLPLDWKLLVSTFNADDSDRAARLLKYLDCCNNAFRFEYRNPSARIKLVEKLFVPSVEVEAPVAIGRPPLRQQLSLVSLPVTSSSSLSAPIDYR